MYITGGPIEWVGKSIKEAHQGRGITNDDFQIVGGFLMRAMEDMKIKKEYIQEVIELY